MSFGYIFNEDTNERIHTNTPSYPEVPETKIENVIKSYGRYSKAINNNNLKREIFIATEFCTTEYSKNTFKLIMFAKPNWFEWKTWEWIKT